jgi:N utilization substance protein A
VQSVEGINEQMADKLAALGMVSVFDIEEVGTEVLMTALEVGPDVAATIVETCSVKAKEVAEQQQRDKEEKDRKAREDASMAQTLLGELTAGGEGEAAAGAAPATEADAAARAADILGNG